ncbi:hypothetical protein Fot_48281 [Forsythia ovata]|uniref:Uncharacterized protein n=1 Tax=Forsythia ovata TaxID=205694 RepID=A0ABD1QSM2_9LAMI
MSNDDQQRSKEEDEAIQNPKNPRLPPIDPRKNSRLQDNMAQIPRANCENINTRAPPAIDLGQWGRRPRITDFKPMLVHHQSRRLQTCTRHTALALRPRSISRFRPLR